MKNKTIHMMGICGTAMGSLAGLLKEMGHHVRGSDQNIYPPMSLKLKEMNIPVKEGYSPDNLNPKPDLVIVGNVMTKKHSEVEALLASDIPFMSLPKAMGEFLIRDRHSIVISGTHGKTTTTALMSWIASEMGCEPGFLIGGVPLNFPNSFSVGKGDTFVIEGDEYDTAFFDKVPKFIHYRPRSVILTSIEFDHADIYKDLEAVLSAFEMLMKRIPSDGHLVFNADDENIPKILKSTACKNLISYGVRSGDYRLGKINWTEQYSEFEVLYKGKTLTMLKTQMFGEYNLLNALAAFALARSLGWNEEKVKAAIGSFRGVKRRQEIIVQKNGITVIDDFAHHPTAVEATILGVKKRFKKSRIIGVFEPRSATSRRKVFQDAFAHALSVADHVVLSQPYDQSKIADTDRLDIQELVKACEKTKGKENVFLGDSTESLVDHLKQKAHSGDVILLMSNGGFGGIYDRLKTQL